MSDEKPSPDPADRLLAELGALPRRRNEHDPAPAAREAFQNAFVPWHQRVFVRASSLQTDAGGTAVLAPGPARLTRAIVPLFLASVVAIYLTWAVSAALALQG